MNIEKCKVCISYDTIYQKTRFIWVFNVKGWNMMIKGVIEMVQTWYVSGSGKKH